MKQFLRESHVKQMMLIQMIIVDPENEKELDIFLSQSLPKEQVDMMMLSFGMVWSELYIFINSFKLNEKFYFYFFEYKFFIFSL